MIKEERDQLIDAAAWHRTEYIQPHEYIVLKDHPELFAALAHALEHDEKVYSEIFKGVTYQYLVIGNYKYWRVGDVVNRERIH